MLHKLDSDATMKLIVRLMHDAQKQLKENGDASAKSKNENKPMDTLDRTS